MQPLNCLKAKNMMGPKLMFGLVFLIYYHLKKKVIYKFNFFFLTEPGRSFIRTRVWCFTFRRFHPSASSQPCFIRNIPHSILYDNWLWASNSTYANSRSRTAFEYSTNTSTPLASNGIAIFIILYCKSQYPTNFFNVLGWWWPCRTRQVFGSWRWSSHGLSFFCQWNHYWQYVANTRLRSGNHC